MVGLAILAGCVPAMALDAATSQEDGSVLEQRAAFDLDCDNGALHWKRLGDNTWGVRACGQRATYILLNGRWAMNNSKADD